MKKTVVAVAALTVALSGSGAVALAVNAQTGAHPTTAQSQQAAKTKTLTISTYTFSPGKLKVSPGQKIKVVNMDAVAHTVTADNGAFDVAAPEKTTVTFNAPETPGTYKYRCTIHHSMKGLLIVR